MIKRYCDRCGQEIKDMEKGGLFWIPKQGEQPPWSWQESLDLCAECAKEYISVTNEFMRCVKNAEA